MTVIKKPVKDITPANVKERYEAAYAELVAMCKGERRFHMSIPVQGDDTDEVIGAALDDIPNLLTEIERLRELATNACVVGITLDEHQQHIDVLRDYLEGVASDGYSF